MLNVFRNGAVGFIDWLGVTEPFRHKIIAGFCRAF